MKKIAIYALIMTAAAAAGCIKNDIPYPVVECQIEQIAVEGLDGEPVIDAANGVVTLPLLETADIQNVRITDVTITEGARASREIVGVHNLTTPMSVVLSLYAHYNWRIEARQTIQRYFTVEGQVGATEWNLDQRTAKVYISYSGSGELTPDMRPTSVRITSLKLGPAGISRMEVPSEGITDFNESNFDRLSDFTTYRRVYVTCHGRREMWDLTVEYTKLKVDFKRIDGWVRTAWFYAEGLSGTELGFRYREAGSSEWIDVPTADIVVEGGSFSARVGGLQPECDYEAIAYSGEDESDVMTFRTEPELPLLNAGFEDWHQAGNVIMPFANGGVPYWDTGNKGSTTLGADYNITTFVNDARPGSSGKTSAQLASKNVLGIKFAAGNIYTGAYGATVGTNARVNFGRPFTSRPVALRGWVKFENGAIDKIGNQPADRTLTTADLDEGQIYIAMGTWTADEYGGTADSPVQVYSADSNTFFNKNAKDVIGYGEEIFTQPTNGWRQFEIKLDYRATDIVPTHLIIVCSASRWGDYFTGSSKNRMWVDDFELVW